LAAGFWTAVVFFGLGVFVFLTGDDLVGFCLDGDLTDPAFLTLLAAAATTFFFAAGFLATAFGAANFAFGLAAAGFLAFGLAAVVAFLVVFFFSPAALANLNEPDAPLPLT
jgi:hypothetical protein